MQAQVSGDADGFTPEEFNDVRRCLETLLSVRAGSQPLDRDFGINYEKIVGYPMNVAQNMLSLEIIEKVEKYEPRAEVENIEFEGDFEKGILIPIIYFVKGEGEEE